MKPFHCLVALCLLVSTSAISGPVRTDDEAIKLAIDAVHKYQLTKLDDDCVLVAAAEKPSYFDVTLRERHTPSCGGGPETGLRMFNVRVRKRDGKLSSDVYDGTTFKPVDRKLKRSH